MAVCGYRLKNEPVYPMIHCALMVRWVLVGLLTMWGGLAVAAPPDVVNINDPDAVEHVLEGTPTSRCAEALHAWHRISVQPLEEAWFTEFCLTAPPKVQHCLDPAKAAQTMGCRTAIFEQASEQRRRLFDVVNGRAGFDTYWPEFRAGEGWSLQGSGGTRMRGWGTVTGRDLQTPVAHLVFLLTVLGTAVLLRRNPGAIRGLSSRGMLGLLVVLGVYWTWIWWSVPHAVWHSNQHGFERVIAVLDGHPIDQVPIAHLHGVGWFVPIQWLVVGSGGWLDVFGAQCILSGFAIILQYLFLRMWTGREDVALSAAALLAFWPPHMRVAPTASMYMVAEVYVIATLLCFLLYARLRDERLFVLALGPLFLAMQTRSEMMVLAPLFAGLILVCEYPDWYRRAWRRRGFWLCLAVFITAFVPRLQVILSHQQSMSTGAMTDVFTEARHMVPVALLSIVVGRQIRGPRWLQGMLVIGLPALVLFGNLARKMVSRIPSLDSTVFDRVYHVFFDLQYTPIMWMMLAVFGLVSLVVRHPRALIFWVGGTAVAAHLYMFFYDCVSTYVRAGLGVGFLIAGVGGFGLAEVIRQMPPPRRPIIMAVSVVGMLGSVAPYGSWLAHRYPKQQAWDLLAASRSLLPAEAVVTYLSNDDPPLQLSDDLQNFNRGDMKQFLAFGPTRTVLGLEEWADGFPVSSGQRDPQKGHYFYRSPACFQLSFTAGANTVWQDGTLVDLVVAPRKASSDTPRIIDAISSDWEHPLCRAVMTRFDVEPVVEIALDDRLAGTDYEQIFHDDAVIGLYRIGRRR